MADTFGDDLFDVFDQKASSESKDSSGNRKKDEEKGKGGPGKKSKKVSAVNRAIGFAS
jgi:hypothetical protein